MKQIKDLLVERLILNKHAAKQEYFFHKEIGVLFNNNTRMILYSISTSEDQEDRDSILGFVISSPFDLEYEDKLGRDIGYKVGVALKYEDLELFSFTSTLAKYGFFCMRFNCTNCFSRSS